MVLDERTRESTDAAWGDWAVDNTKTHEDITTSEDQLTQTGYVPIDFSKLNFNEAVSIRGAWDGSTYKATASFLGRITRYASTSITIKGGLGSLTTPVYDGVYSGSLALLVSDGSGNTVFSDSINVSMNVSTIISSANQNGFNRCLSECDLSAGETFYTGGTYYSSLYIMGQSGPQRVGSGRVDLTSHTAPSWGE